MNLILRPLINEKSMGAIAQGYFTFEVDKTANKRQVAMFVEDKFKVDVIDVKVINLPAKIKNQRTRKGKFSQAGMKKAIVRLKKGQKIAMFEAATEQEVEVRTAEGETLTTVKEKKSLFRDTKVSVERETAQPVSKELIAEETENRAPTKTSQREDKKKGSK